MPSKLSRFVRISAVVAVLMGTQFAQGSPAQATHLTCFGRNATRILTSGSDTYTVTNSIARYGRVVLLTLGGNDVITVDPGLTVPAYICTGSGNDTVTAADSYKQSLYISGGYGNDNLSGGGGNDYIHGSYGFDTIQGNSGTDTCRSPYANTSEGGARGCER